jgi:hypothetical protein
MMPGGVNELVWHFIGHLRIIDDIARDRLAYEDPARAKRPDDYTTPRPEFDYKPDLDELPTAPLLPPPIELPEDHFAGKLRPLKSASQPPFEEEPGPPTHLPWPRIPSVGGGGGGGGPHQEIKVIYEAGGEQAQLQVRQYNIMSDNDVILPGSGVNATILGRVDQLTLHAKLLLEDMASDANQEIPTQWWMPQNNEGVIEFIREFDKDFADRGDTPSEHSVEPGYYLNGELQTPAPPPPDPQLRSTFEHDTGNGLGVWVDAGHNTSFNAAVIVDLSESGRSMIVMGDYFHTNAIFQTNSMMDEDKVSGADDDDSATSGENSADNIAYFIEHPGIYADVTATFAGPKWQVTIVDGDYYNVHTVQQTNYLLDNDVIVQESGDNHYDIVAGANEQGNLAQVFDGTIQYDLIVVMGAYHGMNVIFQNNILLNNDDITLLTDGADPAQSVASGQNALLNAATIEAFGNDNFLPMTDQLSALVSLLGNGTTSLDPSAGDLLPGSGGTFDVLFITGDYYDINAVWQTNVTSDINLIIQMMDAPSEAALGLHPDDDGTQSVITGQNKLTNDAVIVDVGPTDAYVGGQVYGDTILVQADLMPTDGDQAIKQDTQALVPELIAFVNDTQDETPDCPPPAIPPPHDDAMASIMH